MKIQLYPSGMRRSSVRWKTSSRKSPDSFTVGLYGDWGSGKSTIACALRNELKKKNIPLVLFDVWKHEGDSLRRTFLRLLVKELEGFGEAIFKKNYSLDERNENSTTVNSEKQGINWVSLRNNLLVLAAFLFVCIGVYFCAWSVLKNYINIAGATSALLASLFSLIPIGLFFTYINQFIEVKKITTVTDKFKDPHEFETEFKRILVDGLLCHQLVIVFDNLDRVSGEKALEIISTIKTFLDPIDKSIPNKKVVFIIPCDEKAIKRHIKRALNYTDADEDHERYSGEYLRKFFNTILWIPQFYSNELEKLALDSLEKTKIPELNDFNIAALIVQAFDKNPRQIIQYINILISNFLLLKERKLDHIIAQQLPQFAKYLLLIQKFPAIMDQLREKMIDTLEINELQSEDLRKNATHAEFINFVHLTDYVKIQSLELFYKLRKSKFEDQLENCDQLLGMLQTRVIYEILDYQQVIALGKLNLYKTNFAEEIAYLNSLGLADKKRELNFVLKEKMNRNSNPVLALKFIEGIFLLLRYDNAIEINTNTYQTMYYTLSKFSNYIFHVDPQNLLSFAVDRIKNPELKRDFSNLLKKQWTHDFISQNALAANSPDIRESYLTVLENTFLDQADFFLHADLTGVKTVIENKYYSKVDFVERISTDRTRQKNFASAKFLDGFISQANKFGPDEVFDTEIRNQEHIDRLTRVARIISNFNNAFFDETVVRSVLNLFNESFKEIILFQEYSLEEFFGGFEALFLKIHQMLDQKFEPEIVELYGYFTNNFTNPNLENAGFYFGFVHRFRQLGIHNQTTLNATNQCITLLLNSETNPREMVGIIEKTVPLADFLKEKEYFDIIHKRVSREYAFLELFFPLFSEALQEEILLNWVDHPKELLPFLQTIDYQVSDADTMADKILTTAETITNIEKLSALYEMLLGLKTSTDYSFAKYSEQIINLIISQDEALQEFGLDAFKNHSDKINAPDLQQQCENVLQNTFFQNCSVFAGNIKNIFRSNFVGNKKFLNEIVSKNETIYGNILNYLIASGDLDFFSMIKNHLSKPVYITFSKRFILGITSVILSDQLVLINCRYILNLMVSKYPEEFREELTQLVQQYEQRYDQPNEAIREIASALNL